jgi:flagellar protein FliO/FliZ
MLSAWFPLVLAIAVLAAIPFGLKWLQRRMGVGAVGGSVSAKVISAVAVGPHQRVVTVEVGPEESRVWLTLGVTAQNITCLHTTAAGSGTVGAGHLQDATMVRVHE